MAQFYGLPVASLRAAAWRRMLEGGSGFNVSGRVALVCPAGGAPCASPLASHNAPLVPGPAHPCMRRACRQWAPCAPQRTAACLAWHA